MPRSRFLPVKGSSDLLLVQSDLYSLTHGQLIMNPQRPFPTVPLIKLGKEFSKVGDYLSRFSSIPTILELDHLTITGDVTIGSGVTFKVRGNWAVATGSGHWAGCNGIGWDETLCVGVGPHHDPSNLPRPPSPTPHSPDSLHLHTRLFHRAR